MGTNISNLWRKKIIFPATFKGDMLVPWRVVTTPETVMEPKDGDLEGVFPFQNKWFSGLLAIQFVGELDFVAAVNHKDPNKTNQAWMESRGSRPPFPGRGLAIHRDLGLHGSRNRPAGWLLRPWFDGWQLKFLFG